MVSTRVISKAHLEKFLLENSFLNKFYVEYDGYLSNHLAHAAIALHHLRAPVTHLDGFAAAYVRKLEAPEKAERGRKLGIHGKRFSTMSH